MIATLLEELFRVKMCHMFVVIPGSMIIKAWQR